VHPRYVQVVGLRDLTVVLVWGWVLVNQVVAALMSHHWYRRSFRDYPPQRKAIVPYLL
jgi:3-oxo-5-alpha-steroid 4-dehydrogenase 3